MNKYCRQPFCTKKNQLGYSIVEWMIVIALMLFLTAGLLTVFVSSRRATTESLSSSERQDNASFALQILTRDLKQAYFFAQATGENKSLWDLNGLSLAASLDCVDNIASGTFPNAGKYRPLWASIIPSVAANLKMTCINETSSTITPQIGTAFISIKRARGLSQTTNFQADKYYLSINPTGIKIYLGSASELTSGDPFSVWEYIHHVYYLDKEADIPRLRRIRLEKDKMVREEVLVEGIENMQFMFALDEFIASERDGSIHAFASTSELTDDDWNSGRVIGVKIYLLSRALKKTPGYVNKTTYKMGRESFTAPGDAYKRALVSHLLTFQNNMVLADE